MPSPENNTMAVFCDFENVALGVRDENYEQFDMGKIVERLLLRGSIIVKKAYCDWGRFREFKNPMHQASFELIDVPHVRQSGKNSADIRMVVDALDLCYTKQHVGTFVIVSGDSDFSPLVSKLRENNKTVIGVGVKNSTSDLLVANCDEFIFYDDLVKPRRKARPKPARPAARRKASGTKAVAKTGKEDEETNQELFDLVCETAEVLLGERGEEDKVWGSMIKQALRRRKPGFTESHYGFNSFNKVIEEAAARHLLNVVPDERSGGYIIRGLAEED